MQDLITVHRKTIARKLDVWNDKTHVTWPRPCTLQIELAEGEAVKIAHREYFVLNDDFEDILDTLGDNKEIENDFEEVSESVSNTEVIFYPFFLSLVLKWK